MATLTNWDHLFALAVFIVFPVYSKLTIKSSLDDIRNRGEPARVSAYRQVILTFALFAIFVLFMWWFFDRNWIDIGVRGIEWSRFAIGLTAALVVTAIFVMPLRNLYLADEPQNDFDDQLGDIAVFMPVTRKEERWFKGVSINAGVSEELIFRGYLIWYLGHFVELWVAAVMSVLLFGLAHSYQGLKMLPGIMVVSAVAVLLYVYTGSLLVPIIFHIALDALQGHYIARIRRRPGIPEIRKTYDLPFPADRVFSAWISDEYSVHPVTSIDVDPRVNGHFRLKMESDEHSSEMDGEILAFEQDRHLRYTWHWGGAERPSIVDIRFSGRENQTQLVVTHTQLATVDSVSQTENGWDSYLSGLEKLLADSAWPTPDSKITF